MKKNKLLIVLAIFGLIAAVFQGCSKKDEEDLKKPEKCESPGCKPPTTDGGNGGGSGDGDGGGTAQTGFGKNTKVIFLHHSTGKKVYEDGGVPKWIANYNSKNKTNYTVDHEFFTRAPYPWVNYPYDYYKIWVKNAGNNLYKNQKTLEILTKDYNVIVWKHCFPVTAIYDDTGSPNIDSERKSLENYKLQYNALKKKMKSFPNTRFLVWTGAVYVEGELLKFMDKASATKRVENAKKFFEWVKKEWDESGDNIYIWDYYELATEGGLFLKNEYAHKIDDSHPNTPFAKQIAPLFCNRLVNVIKGKGDTTSLLGK